MTKAFSLLEILISVAVMSIISLYMANFTSDMFNVSFKHAESLTNVSQSRQVSKLISNEINRAEYIFPSGLQFNLYVPSSSISVNTQDAVAFLTESDTSGDYVLKVFYIENNNLYLFVAANELSWPTNTLPYSLFATGSGSSGLVMSNIDTSKTTLAYTLNENNGNSDIILKGMIGGAQNDDANALIRGFDWKISMNNKYYYIGGVSQDVPR